MFLEQQASILQQIVSDVLDRCMAHSLASCVRRDSEQVQFHRLWKVPSRESYANDIARLHAHHAHEIATCGCLDVVVDCLRVAKPVGK